MLWLMSIELKETCRALVVDLSVTEVVDLLCKLMLHILAQLWRIGLLMDVELTRCRL